jgi:hypothetical protein
MLLTFLQLCRFVAHRDISRRRIILVAPGAKQTSAAVSPKRKATRLTPSGSLDFDFDQNLSGPVRSELDIGRRTQRWTGLQTGAEMSCDRPSLNGQSLGCVGARGVLRHCMIARFKIDFR